MKHLHTPASQSRRQFIHTTAHLGLAAIAAPVLFAQEKTVVAAKPQPESLVKTLHDSLTEAQRAQVCFDWDFKHPKFGLLRTHVSNHWNVSDPEVASDFFTADQQQMVRLIFEGLTNPEWLARFDQQAKDDSGGFGKDLSFAIFGQPGTAQYEFVMAGRHRTFRCDGNTQEHVAFGGPIFYGHGDGRDKVGHPGNVFWSQALAANELFQMMDGRQQTLALVEKQPREKAVGLDAQAPRPGLPLSGLSADQRGEVQKFMKLLLDPFRQGDRDEVAACLAKQGGLDACSLAFYQQGDMGDDRQWDVWRLEGPGLVWYFRGEPHVHVWVNIADSPQVELNSRIGLGDRTQIRGA